MSEREALMDRVLARPDDNAPRLALADWLQAHGEPERAEFIRVQVELARTYRHEPGWLELYQQGCLRAVPDFVARRKQDDPAGEEMTVPVASGPLKLALSWVVDEG